MRDVENVENVEDREGFPPFTMFITPVEDTETTDETLDISPWMMFPTQAPSFSFRDAGGRLFASTGIDYEARFIFEPANSSNGADMSAAPHQLLPIFISGAKEDRLNLLKCIRWYYIIQPGTLMQWFQTMLPQIMIRLPRELLRRVMFSIPFEWRERFFFDDDHITCIYHFLRQNPRLYTRVPKILGGRLLRKTEDNLASRPPNEVIFIETVFHLVALIADSEMKELRV